MSKASNRRRSDERAQTRVAELEQQLADLRSITGWIDPDYAAALKLAQEVAYSPLRRPDLGTKITDGSTDSRPPAYIAAAYDVLRKQRAEQRKQAAEIHKALRKIIDNDTDPSDGAERLRPVQTLGRPATAHG